MTVTHPKRAWSPPTDQPERLMPRPRRKRNTGVVWLVAPGVLSLVGALIAFGVAQADKNARADDRRVNNIVTSMSCDIGSGAFCSEPDHSPITANMAPTIVLAIIGVVLLTWAVILVAGAKRT
jgi:hypothetical protein